MKLTNEQYDAIQHRFDAAERIIVNLRAPLDWIHIDGPDWPAYRLLSRVQFHINNERQLEIMRVQAL